MENKEKFTNKNIYFLRFQNDKKSEQGLKIIYACIQLFLPHHQELDKI